ncbi:response regulator [Candidatus Parcubacteria bacterium]|nr:response regulator [Candidatus Parcubacteria bacterium]
MENDSAKKIKILIIEDEHSLVDLLSVKLKKEGFDVEFSYDGEAGYKKALEWKPNIILLDIVMPKMDGYEVLEKMKENDIKIPVIIISNSGQPVEIEKTRKLGAVDHLIKTEFSPLDVLKKVRACVENGGKPAADDPDMEVLIPREDSSARKLGVKVLLVEDDAFLREICSKKLTKEGYTVYEAIDGEQALEGVKQVKPDIILLDIILPAIDGFQILNEIKSNPNEAISKVPVIMLSNLGQDDDIKKAMDAGADDYLVKAHFTTEEIVSKIKKIMGKN